MKNWGKFFMMVAVFLSLIACGEKGGGSGGGRPSVNVPKNEDLARLISNNIKELDSYEDNFANDLSYTIFELSRIKEAYEKGNKTISEVERYKVSSRSNMDRYISSRNWLNFNNISLTHINLSLINLSLVVDPNERLDVERAKEMFELEEGIIINRRNLNKYYLELMRSESIDKFLSNPTIHDPNKNYRTYLNELEVLSDQQSTNEYLKRIKTINLDLEILRKKDVVYSIDELEVSNPTTTRYKIGGFIIGGQEYNSVISENNRNRLIQNLELLKEAYLKGNSLEITQKLAAFDEIDRNILSSSIEGFMTFYDIFPHETIPGKLQIGNVAANGLESGENLLEELVKIRINPENDLSKFEADRLFLLIRNIENYIKQIEDYSYSNPTINKYSKTVNSLQLIQLLWDEKDFITPILKRNKN